MTRLAGCVACAMLAFGTLAAAPSTPAPVPTASPTPNPAMLAQARNIFSQIQTGKIDRSQLSPEMNAALTPDQINGARALVGALGTPVTFEQQQAGVQNTITYAIYLVTFGDGKKFNFLFAVDTSGKIVELRLAPPQ